MNYMDPLIESIKQYEQANIRLEEKRAQVYASGSKQAMKDFQIALAEVIKAAQTRNKAQRNLYLRIEAEALGQLGIVRSYDDE